ncbi:MAG: rane protein [Solirubrobacteraceae bacterium]|nr:rane protein [Solirubrobacteraceae bacterium]
MVGRAGGAVKAFYWRAYEDNLTGLAGMVAYNLLLSILPLALLALFIAGQIAQSGELEKSILRDLRHLFPGAAESTLSSALRGVERSSVNLGIAALISSVWFGSSFWGALDTAFCRIYHFKCRTWLEQKRFALAMLVVVLLFMAATVAVPTLQSILVEGAQQLPFGLARVRDVVFVATLAGGVLLLFAVLCLIYWTVPNRNRMSWRTIWPGAAAATAAITIVDYSFPLYLSRISTISRIGTTLVFILIVLLWFYAIAIIILGGATINAMRVQGDEPAT